jgi:hypothetical protein
VRGATGAGIRRRGRTGRRAPALVAACAVALCLGAIAPAARAQEVGTAPERSPFQDILTHQAFTLFAGRFAGSAGAAHTGARPGLMIGGRLDVRVSGALGITATFAEALTSRLRINAGGTTADTAKDMGTLDFKLISADLGFTLNLTGDKTWHRLAPYAAIGAGLTTSSARVVDPGGFQIGTGFSVVASLGTRFYLSRSLALRLEVRDLYYRYTFPLAYFDRPYATHGDGTPVLSNSVGDREWYQNYIFWVGLTYGFNF